jgi:DNA mismatch repair protein MutS
VLDKTKTAMGARLLRSRIEQPLTDAVKIQKRLDGVEAFKDNIFAREELRELISGIYDIERLMSKVVYASANARDLIALKQSFEILPHLKHLLGEFDCDYIQKLHNSMDTLEDIRDLIDKSIAPDPPVSLREGGIIRDGYNSEVDTLRSAKEKGAQWLADFEAREKEKTGIPKLRVKYNKVFGYYMEVTNSYLSAVPDTYIRKRTLSNSECYITQELKEIENTILGADEKVVSLEYDLFSDIRAKVGANTERILKCARDVSAIDVLQSLGEVADKNGYVKPTVNTGNNINIVNGRHPVVERVNTTEFIPNDTVLDTDENRLSIITGPNMAGKSTYMRQVALLVLMAQIGSFVPADSAEIGVVDRIFTRVGASDDLATGQSTFMVEMTEVANILNNATNKSLLILDEIGRGTSTFDGLSIAWAVLEYIADKKRIGARTLFATHYHELTELERKIDGVNNYCVSVLDNGDDVIFLRKIVRGGTDKSYGIHVAKLAGVPKSVVRRSNEILTLLTKDNEPVHASDVDEVYVSKPYDQKVIVFNELSDELDELDINTITPMDALKKLNDLKEKLKELQEQNL